MSADQFHYVVYEGHISTRCKLKLSHTTFWAVLTRESAAGPKRISFYNTQAEFVTGLQPQFFLELRNILRVQQVETKGKTQRPYQFKIISTSSTQLFATKTAKECQKWVKSMTDLMQGIPEPSIVYEFQIFVQPGGHAEQLNLSGLYILKVFDRFLQLYSASGAFPTDFHCSLANATVFCTATNIRESEAGMLMIQTSSNADIGEGKLAFSAKSAIDFTRVVEHRRKCMSKNEATTLKLRRSLSLSEVFHPSPSRSRNISPDPKLLVGVSQHQCLPSPTKSPRQSAPVFPGHAMELILPHDSAPGSDKSSMLQPKSSQRPRSAILPNNWKPIRPPQPQFRPASPNPSQGRRLSPQPDIKLSGAHSNSQISTNKGSSPTSKSRSNFLKALLPVPHHKSAHANKSDIEDPTNSSLPSAASPIKDARSPPTEQGKVKRSDSEPTPTTPSKYWKPIPPPKPSSRPASPNPSSESVSPHPDIGLSGSHSNNQTHTNETTPPTPKSPSNSARVLLPVPHHHILTHSTKSDVGDSTTSSTASPKKVARFSPKDQVKVDDSKPEGSRNEAAPNSFMYLDKSAEDSGDYEVSDIEMGIDKSSCIDLMVEKNTAYGVVEMGLGDKSSSVVTDLESSGYEYVEMGIGNGPIVKKNTTGEPGVNTYLDVVLEKPPTTVGESSAGESGVYEYVETSNDNENPTSIVEESLAGESGVYEYIETSNDNENPTSIVEKNIAGESGEYEYVDVEPPFTVKNNVVGKSTVDLQALRQKESIGDKHPALVGLQANGPQMTRDTAISNNNSPGVCVMENLKEDQSVGDTELSKKARHKKQGSPRRPPPPRPPPPAHIPKKKK